MRDSEQIHRELDSLLCSNKIDDAIEYVKTMSNGFEGENCAFKVLRHNNATPELIDALLESYTTKLIYKCRAIEWSHSLSHFTELLWEHKPNRLDEWIKKTNKLSFELSTKCNEVLCSERLINDFVHYAKFDEDPKDFNITKENTTWFNWDRETNIFRQRIELAPFESKADYLRYKLNNLNEISTFHFESQNDIINLEKIDSIIKEFESIGENADKYKKLVIHELEKQLEMFKKGEKDEREHIKKRCKLGIEYTEAQLKKRRAQ